MSAPVNIVLAAVGSSAVISALEGVKGALAGMAAVGISTTAVVGTLWSTISKGVEFNAQLEQARLGVAAVLKQFDDVGKFKSFDDALKESADAIDLLKQKAVTSPSSFSSLVAAFQGTVGPMTAANIALRDQVNLIVNMSQALAGLGIREDQILQETRALITGNINADAAAAKILGITSADVAQAKAKGQLYEFLAGKISSFAVAGERGAQSLNTLKSNLGDAFEQRSADATKDLNEALKGLYSQLTILVNSQEFQQFVGVFANNAAAVVGFATGITSIAGKLNGIVTAEGAATLGTMFAASFVPKIVGKLDFTMLDWATRSGGPMGTAFIGKMLVPWTGALAKFLPIGLAAAIATEVAYGIYSGIAQWRSSQLDAANAGFDRVGSATRAAQGITSEDARVAALKQLSELEQQTSAALAGEEARIWKNGAALSSYRQQIEQIHALQRLLNSGWAEQQIALNQAAAAAAAVAKSEAVAKAWLAGDATSLSKLVTDPKQLEKLTNFSAEKARDTIGQQMLNQRAQQNPEAALADAQAFLGVMDRTLAIYRAERDAGRNTAENQKNMLETSARRATALVSIAGLEELIARRTSETAQNELNATLRNIERQRAILEGNIGVTDADKWPIKKQLLADEIVAQQHYLDVLQDRLKVTKDIAAREALSGQVRGGLDQLSSLYGQQAQLGPNPSSWSDQMVSANTAAANSIGTLQQQVARGWSQSADSVRSSMGTALGDIVLTSNSTSSIVKAGAWSIAQSFIRHGAQMVADWAYKHTILAAVHSLFESGATAATAAGAGTRTALEVGATTTTVALKGVEVGAHVAGEGVKTTSTLFGGAIRIGVVIKEALASVIHGAVSAFEALASIPYVGPFLGAAAMAAALVGGMALIGKISGREQGGPVRAGTPYIVGEKRPEVFVPTQDGTIIPSLAAYGDLAGVAQASLADRADSLSAAASSPSYRGMSAVATPAAAGASARPIVNVAYFTDEPSARQWLSTKQGQRHLVRQRNNNRQEWGDAG